jgi:hypothetical protein
MLVRSSLVAGATRSLFGGPFPLCAGGDRNVSGTVSLPEHGQARLEQNASA